MTGHFLLADMTSHRRGYGVQPIIAAARRAQTNHNSNVLWLVPSYLMAAFNANTDQIRNCDILGPALWTLIESELERIKSTAPDAVVTVVTWDPFIYGKVRGYGQQTAAVKMIDWINENRGPRVPFSYSTRPPLPQSVGTLPSVEKLQETALTYLKSIGATSEPAAIYRSQLRPNLVRAAAELRPTSHHPQFQFLLRTALETAISNKLIGQDRSSPGNEKIWAIEPTGVVAHAQETPLPPKEHQAVGALKAPTYQRTAEFRKRLTDLGIFCEKRERDILMEATSQLLKNGPLAISKLRRELPKVAKEMANERNRCPGTDFNRIVGFFLKLLLVSGSLTNESGTMKRDASAEATPAVALVANAIDVVEAYLVEQILKRSDVKDHEHWQLALTLFREFDQSASIDDKLDRIAVLIGRLKDRVILTDEGMYEYIPMQTTIRMALAKA